MSNLLIYNDRVNKRNHVDRIYPALWPGDTATVTITSYDKRYDARLRITDGSAVLLPWPVSHPSRIFHNALQSLGMVRIGKHLRFRSDAIEEYINTGGDLKLMKEVRNREATGAEAGD